MSAAIETDGHLPQHLQARQPMRLRHSLCDHPALDREAVAALAEFLGIESVAREAAVKPLVYPDGAPEPARTASAAELVRQLEDNDAWLTLLNIEKHPRYRALIDEQLDRLAASVGAAPEHWRRRMGFVFASSPGSVTGAHFDIEHSLLMQLRGRRTLSFGDFQDAATREAEIRRYWRGSYGKLASMPVPRAEYRIGPGDGMYIPPYQPHWLHNGDSASLSLTITFFTRDNENESLVQACNERLRTLRLRPRPYGTAPLADRAKVVIMRVGGALAGGLAR